jgi:hypothetical protein
MLYDTKYPIPNTKKTIKNHKNKRAMKSTHFVKVLSALDAKELKKFEEWVNSPFFNKNEKVKKLCSFVLEYAPAFEHKAFTKENAFQKLYPKEPYDIISFNNVLSDLLQLLFDFLAYQNFQRTNEFEKICLMNELFAKGLNDSMLKISKRFEKSKAQTTIRNSSHFFDKYLHNKQLDEYQLTQPTRDFNDHLQLKNNALDLFYMATKLKIACDMTSRNLVIQGNYDCHFLEEIIARIENNTATYQTYPAIMVYYNVLQTMRNADSAFYFQLKELLANNLLVFPKEELRVLYDYARNYCIRKINQGHSVYYQEILSLYQFLLEKKIIFKKGYLTEWDYKNIVTVGLRLKQYEWTEQFINQYKSYLPQKEQENAFVYNMAVYHYERKAYKKSLLMLYEVRFTDASYHIGAKIIQIKSYFELEESEAFYALIETFRIYIIRNKTLSEFRKKANLNFLKLAQKAFKLREKEFSLPKKNFQDQQRALIEDIKTTSPLINNSWLMEVVEKDIKN